MAHGQRTSVRLTAFFAASLFILPVFFSQPRIAAIAWASKQAPSRHLSSNESLNSRRKYKQWREMKKGARRVSVKKIGAVKLKKSSFWNKKPFQFSTPLVDESALFIGVDAGVFYAIDASRIKKLWQYKTEGPVQARAGVAGDVVYFGDADGYAYALSKSDGKELWKVSLESPVLTAPLIVNDRIYFVTENGRMFALARDSGQELAHTDSLEKSVGFSVRRASNPVWSNGLILFGTTTGTLLAYRENGNLAWVKQLGDRQGLVYDLDSQPLLDGGHIYVATADRKVFCLDPANGNIVWSDDDAGGPNDLTIDNGKLYATGGGVLSVMNSANGDVLWEQDFETPEISSPAVSNKTVAVITTSNKFYLVDDDTGDIMFDRVVRKGSFGDPLFVDNRLYMISNTGVVYSFLVRDKPAKEKRVKEKPAREKPAKATKRG